MIREDIHLYTETKFEGLVYQTYSELDVIQLTQILSALKEKKKLPEIDNTSIISTFEGHTMFSIFQGEVLDPKHATGTGTKVYE